MFGVKLPLMTSEKALVVTLKVSGKELEMIRTAAAEEGLKGDDGVLIWLTNEAERCVRLRSRFGSDMSPKEVMAELGIKHWGFRALVLSNAFPNLYYKNPRVIRIPRADVEAYKASRARSIA